MQLNDLPARTHASQGEQRSLALALRLASHRLVHTTVGTPPVLLLDDVFSELDPQRSTALLSSLPPARPCCRPQRCCRGVQADQVLRVTPGSVEAV